MVYEKCSPYEYFEHFIYVPEKSVKEPKGDIHFRYVRVNSKRNAKWKLYFSISFFNIPTINRKLLESETPTAKESVTSLKTVGIKNCN